MTKLTVLLVDDDEVDRMAARRALRNVVTLVEASDATSAEAALKSTRVDLVLLDYFIPPDTGPEVLARLRTVRPNLPCIFLSGQGNEAVVVEAMKAGAEDYLPKAAVNEPRRLVQLIERTWEAHQLRMQAQRDAARLSLAIEASGAGTWSVDFEARTVRAGDRFRVMFGLEGNDWPLETWFAAFRPDDAKKLAAAIEEGSVNLQAELAAAGHWVELRGRREEGGTGLFGTVIDVSQSKAAEVRTLAMKDRLMGIASHDLKNPLSAVKMGAMMLSKSKALDEKDRRVVSHISTSAERMTKLISQLLDLTRVRLGGGLPLDRQSIDLKTLVDGIVEEAKLGSGGRDIRAQTESVPVSVDPDRIQQVVSNLVGNAITHGDATQPIVVSLETIEGHPTVTVENHGAQIPREQLENLFEPFVQGGRSTSREGLGLGLFISREVMNAHGGSLTATSSAEGVTRFIARF